MAGPSQSGPGTAPPGQKQKGLWRHGAAYACYGFVSLAAMLMGYVTTFVSGQDQEGNGFFFMMLVPPTLVALVAIIVLTAMIWRDTQFLDSSSIFAIRMGCEYRVLQPKRQPKDKLPFACLTVLTCAWQSRTRL